MPDQQQWVFFKGPNEGHLSLAVSGVSAGQEKGLRQTRSSKATVTSGRQKAALGTGGMGGRGCFRCVFSGGEKHIPV